MASTTTTVVDVLLQCESELQKCWDAAVTKLLVWPKDPISEKEYLVSIAAKRRTIAECDNQMLKYDSLQAAIYFAEEPSPTLLDTYRRLSSTAGKRKIDALAVIAHMEERIRNMQQRMELELLCQEINAQLQQIRVALGALRGDLLLVNHDGTALTRPDLYPVGKWTKK